MAKKVKTTRPWGCSPHPRYQKSKSTPMRHFWFDAPRLMHMKQSVIIAPVPDWRIAVAKSLTSRHSDTQQGLQQIHATILAHHLQKATDEARSAETGIEGITVLPFKPHAPAM
jgi:hypothetical protein